MTTPGSAEASYYTWVDQFNTLGLGRNVPVNTGNESEGLLVLKDGKFVILRVPQPLGFYTKWVDTSGSTIRTPAGKDAVSGRASARARRFIRKATKA